MKTITKFYDILFEQMQTSLKQVSVLEEVSETLFQSIKKDGIIHVFGCGHSQMFGEELCFRTGGLACVNAIMIPQYNIYPKASLSQLMERSEGFAQGVLDTQYTTPNDTMIIVSISGRNAAGIDMALKAKEKGMKVIALTSLDYTSNVSSRHSNGKLLKDVSDIIVDLTGVKGDAVLENAKISEKYCSTSTIVGMSLLIGCVGEAIDKCASVGIDPDIWVSGNLDRGDSVNAHHMKKFSGKVTII